MKHLEELIIVKDINPCTECQTYLFLHARQIDGILILESNSASALLFVETSN